MHPSSFDSQTKNFKTLNTSTATAMKAPIAIIASEIICIGAFNAGKIVKMIAKTVIMRNHRFTPTSLVLSRIPDDNVSLPKGYQSNGISR
ncbi:hypothetical protein FQS60_22235 [Escherichia coli]|nr:hypothetical protein [Escherichia coli]